MSEWNIFIGNPFDSHTELLFDHRSVLYFNLTDCNNICDIYISLVVKRVNLLERIIRRRFEK